MTIQALPKWNWVFNPVYIDFGQQAVGSLRYATVQIWDGSTLLSEAVYFSIDDYLKADISGFLKSVFRLIPEDVKRQPQDCPSETYKNLTIIVYANETNTLIYSDSHTFVFGGKKPIDDFSISKYFPFNVGNDLTDFLTEFERPTIFEGYPFQLWFSKDGNTNTLNEFMTIASYETFQKISEGQSIAYEMISLGSNGSGRDILKLNPVEDSGIITSGAKFITVSSPTYLNNIVCNFVTPKIPGGVMLRWLNRLGGIEHWYFIRKDTKNPIKTISVPLIESILFTDNWNPGIGKVVDKEYSQTIVLGDYDVPVKDYEVISRISKSSRVDMYVGSGKWIQVMVQDSDWNLSHDNDYQDIEFAIITV